MKSANQRMQPTPLTRLVAAGEACPQAGLLRRSLLRRRGAAYAYRPAAALSPSYVGGGLPPDGAAESSVRLWR